MKRADKIFPQIGMTYQILNNRGIHDLKTIAEEYYHQQAMQQQQGIWGYDRYLKHGAHSSGTINSLDAELSHECTVWSINHYLGLNRHPYVIRKAKEILDIYGTGCGTSAMSGGHSQLHKNLQKRFARLMGKEETLLFSTGFTVNSGVIASLCRTTKTLILIDRDCHASIIDGCKASGSQFLPFKHNSVVDLETKLKKYSPKYINILVVTEGAYSMQGDLACLEEIVSLKNKYNFLLYVDEAHSFGIYGDKGAGLCRELKIEKEVDFIMTTLSKATASIGGIVATSKEFASLLRFSTTYLFQAAIPPVDVAVIDACLDILEKDQTIRQHLLEKADYLREKVVSLGFDVGNSRSPIIPIYIRDPNILRLMEKELFINGIFTIAIQHPAVSKTEGRFRFIINNSHTFEDIDALVSILQKLGKQYAII